MELFEDRPIIVKDWYEVCPNADEDMFNEVEAMRSFDALLFYIREWDRAQVAKVLCKALANRGFLLKVLINTFPNNAGLLFCARELLHKVSDKLLCSVMAFSHDGIGRVHLQFPDKKEKIPRSLYSAFGLRRNEEHWFEQLAANETFVRLVANNIKKDDWVFIMYNKRTLFKEEEEKDTAPKLVLKNQENLW